MIKKALHIILSALVLVSSSGLIINKHYCLDQLVSVGVMVEAEKCHPVPPQKSDRSSSHEKLDQADCCKDTSSFLKVNQEQKVELTAFSWVDWVKSTFILQVGLNFPFTVLEDQLAARRLYKPPLWVWDRSIHLQTFLC